MRICNRKPRVPMLAVYVLCILLGFTLREQLLLLDGGYHGAYQKYVRNVPLQNTINTLQMTCQPRMNVMFLKTHKTGSSTVLNIMYRFTEKYNLSLALPEGRSNLFHYPEMFQSKYIEGFLKKEPGYTYNIICNHLRFNLPEIQKFMPNNTIYVSILRNPISLMESSFAYHSFLKSFSKSKNLNGFLTSPEKFYYPNEFFHMFAKNTMWYDFGYDNNANDTDSYVQSVLQEIEQRFQLLLIAEYFDESMVLLKNTLCWDLDDVIYFKLNSRSKETVEELTENSKEKVKEWCSLDWKLYQHFNQTFWRRIHETIGPEEMEKELELMRSRQKEIRDICLQEGEPVGKGQIKASNLQPLQSGVAHILGYNIKPSLSTEMQRMCESMIMPELHHLRYMRFFQSQHEIKTA